MYNYVCSSVFRSHGVSKKKGVRHTSTDLLVDRPNSPLEFACNILLYEAVIY